MQFLGASARRVRSRANSSLDHLDLVHEGWIAWRDAMAEGATVKAAYAFAENRMTTCVERERRGCECDPPDDAPSTRRLTPSDWRTLHTWLRRVLWQAPSQLGCMELLFRGRSIEEVQRELGVSRHRAYELRSKAIAELNLSLTAQRGAAVTKARPSS
jgi:hypothetical protein